ncbi:MAG: ribbon-helix-helix domain-containing protein [Nanoarchaeota archaeon]
MKKIIDENVHILNVRLPDDILLWLDQIVKSGSYQSRSEIIRDFIREYIKHD